MTSFGSLLRPRRPAPLGERMENILFEILENMIEAKFSKSKGEILHGINLKLEKFRYLVRLCKALKFMTLRRYQSLAGAIDVIGRLIGGWVKQEAETAMCRNRRG